MKKQLFIVGALLLSTVFVKAQTDSTSTSTSSYQNTMSASSYSNSGTYSKKALFGIGLNLAVPVTSGWKIGYGADLQLDIPTSQKLFITVSGGYENYSYKAIMAGPVTIPEGSTNFIPVMGGIKYFFSDKFYGHGQAGYTFSTTSGGGGAFTFAPSIGYNFSRNFDASLKYVNIGETNSSLSYGGKQIGSAQLRLAYNF